MRRFLLFGALLACAYQGSFAQAQNEEIVEGEVFITFREGVTTVEKNEVLKKYDLKLIKFYEFFGFGLYQTTMGTLDVIEKVRKEPSVIRAGPNHFRSANAVPNDPSYGSQWYLAKINWPDAWTQFTGTQNVIVAVVDSGVSKTHLQLNSALMTSSGERDYYDNDNNADDGFGHGTLVAGIIAAKINDGSGVAGICPTAKILPFRVFNNAGQFAQATTSAIVSSLDQSILHGAKVVNLSLGSTGYNINEWIAIDICRDYGILVVCAAGNGGSDRVGDSNDSSPVYPASYNLDNILAVAATDENDDLAIFSNYGANRVHLAAPGQHILGCDVARQIVYDWTFDFGWDGWEPFTTTGYGWIRSAYFGDYGITSRDWTGFYTGFYQPYSLMALFSPIVNLAGQKSCRLQVTLGGLLGAGDYLDIAVMSSDYSGLTRFGTLAYPGWAYGTVARDISVFDNAVGRAALILDADAFGLGQYSSGQIGIQRIQITALSQGLAASNAVNYNDGTSFSAPMVSGVAAMLFSQNPSLSCSQVRQIILDKTRKVAALSGKVFTGGVLDAGAALRESKARVVVRPAITSSTSASGTVGSSFSYSITASGTPTSYNASSLPSGLSVNTSTGVISGTPSSAGTFTSSISASNTSGTGSASLRITIAKATPAIISSPTASAITFGQTLATSTLSGGSASVAGNFAWTTPSANPNLGISSQGVIFTPNERTNYNTVTTSVSVTVNQVEPVVITSDLSEVSVNLGASFSHQITASGSPTSFGAFRLPTGLKINAKTGLISGMPTKVGVFSVTLQALKKGSTTAIVTKVFTVVQVPTFSYATRINAQRNKNVNVRPKVAGSPAPSFSVVSGSLPPGLSLNASTAAITGIPTAAGSYPFTVRGSNSAGNTDRSATIVVK